MENLPIDAIEMVCRYLTEQEISVCCLVCKTWSCLFNDDTIWRPLCSPRAELEEHLRTTPCIVEPSFTPEIPADSTLGPTGQWKLAKMRESQLWNNIEKGAFIEKKIVHDEKKGFPQSFGFLTDDLVYLIFDKNIEVWNTSVNPTVRIAEYSHSLNTTEVKSFSVVGEKKNMALVVDRFQVKVFEIHPQTGHLNGIADFNFGAGEKASVKGNNDGDVPKCLISGSSLVGLNRGVSGKMRVWDLAHGKTISEENGNMPGFHIVDIFGSQNTSDIVTVIAPEKQTLITQANSFGFYLADPSQYVYMVYCLKGGHYFKFKAESNSTNGYTCSILNSFVAILDKEALRIFNYRTNKLVHEGKGGFSCHAKNYDIYPVGDYFLFDSSCEVVAFNPQLNLYVKVGTGFFEAFMFPSFSTMHVLDDLYQLGKSCCFLSEKGAFQFTNDKLRSIGIFNCQGINHSGARYLTISHYVNKLESIALMFAEVHPSKPSTHTSSKKRQLIVVRQFW